MEPINGENGGAIPRSVFNTDIGVQVDVNADLFDLGVLVVAAEPVDECRYLFEIHLPLLLAFEDSQQLHPVLEQQLFGGVLEVLLGSAVSIRIGVHLLRKFNYAL